MLYRYQIKFRVKALTFNSKSGKWATPAFCEITMVPTKLGRWLGCQLRRGIGRRADDDDDGQWHWWWANTDRYVGRRLERLIEAAPIDTIEDMPIELLLEEREG
jgi:hypothetical protein